MLTQHNISSQLVILSGNIDARELSSDIINQLLPLSDKLTNLGMNTKMMTYNLLESS